MFKRRGSRRPPRHYRFMRPPRHLRLMRPPLLVRAAAAVAVEWGISPCSCAAVLTAALSLPLAVPLPPYSGHYPPRCRRMRRQSVRHGAHFFCPPLSPSPSPSLSTHLLPLPSSASLPSAASLALPPSLSVLASSPASFNGMLLGQDCALLPL